MFRKPEITGLTDSLRDDSYETYRSVGHITKIVGLTIESAGPVCSIGDLVNIKSSADSTKDNLAEVVGFRDDRVLLFRSSSENYR